ncbi:unnamed protein product, partial [Didymodactylos carnosus]
YSLSYSKISLTAMTQIITRQPKYLESMFSTIPNEDVFRVYRKRHGCCGMGGTDTTTVTNARLLKRFEEWRCCGRGTSEDTMIFLKDIQLLSQVNPRRRCNLSSWLLACFTCTWPCYLCCVMCCRRRTRVIEVRGAFGTEEFLIPYVDVRDACAQIPAAAAFSYKARNYI